MKFFNNPVNRIMSAVFWIIGWMISYGIIYYAGYNTGSAAMYEEMHKVCVIKVPLKFDGDNTIYVCMRAKRDIEI